MDGVDEIWRAEFPLASDGPHAVLPDVRFGLSVLRLPDGALSPMVATRPHPEVRFAPLIPGAAAAGVYFKPGRGPDLDASGPVVPVARWPRLAAALGAYAGDPGQRGALLNALADVTAELPGRDPSVAAMLARLGDEPIEALGRLAEDLGMSERQLRRRFQTAVGLSPRSFAVTARLHASLVALVRAPRPHLAALASDYGYADQSHWGRLVKRAYARSLRDAHAALREHRARFVGRHMSETF